MEFVKQDSFDFQIRNRFDLIVADPYYEDTLRFLALRSKEICDKAGMFVCVCAGEEKEHARMLAKNLLREACDTDPEERIIYGQSILISRVAHAGS